MVVTVCLIVHAGRYATDVPKNSWSQNRDFLFYKRDNKYDIRHSSEPTRYDVRTMFLKPSAAAGVRVEYFEVTLFCQSDIEEFSLPVREYSEGLTHTLLL